MGREWEVVRGDAGLGVLEGQGEGVACGTQTERELCGEPGDRSCDLQLRDMADL